MHTLSIKTKEVKEDPALNLKFDDEFTIIKLKEAIKNKKTGWCPSEMKIIFHNLKEDSVTIMDDNLRFTRDDFLRNSYKVYVSLDSNMVENDVIRNILNKHMHSVKITVKLPCTSPG